MPDLLVRSVEGSIYMPDLPVLSMEATNTEGLGDRDM